MALGNAALIKNMSLDSGTLVDIANARRDEGETVIFIVPEGTIASLVSVADPARKSKSKHCKSNALSPKSYQDKARTAEELGNCIIVRVRT